VAQQVERDSGKCRVAAAAAATEMYLPSPRTGGWAGRHQGGERIYSFSPGDMPILDLLGLLGFIGGRTRFTLRCGERLYAQVSRDQHDP